MRGKHIVVVMDRSGSMESIKNDAMGGLRAFLATAAEIAGKTNQETRVSLYEFDHEYGPVYERRPILSVVTDDPYVLRPRGGTALLDAVGRTLTVASGRPDEDVFLVIATDGEENRSTEWRLEDLKAALAAKQEEGWDVTFLGANQDAFKVGSSMGVKGSHSLTYDSSSDGTQSAWRSVGALYTRSGLGDRSGFTEQERTDSL